MITYDEVANWWDNSEWAGSDYPPSAWFNYCEREGIDIDELRDDPDRFEDAVAELHAEGDGRTCDCEWAEHESTCNWTPEEADENE